MLGFTGCGAAGQIERSKSKMTEVNVPRLLKFSMNRPSAYATKNDLCRIFSEQKKSLYLLALLLTADAEKAEQCFVAGIGDRLEGNPVFREWARSWVRRTIIQRAIRMIEPARQKLTVADTEPVTLEVEPRLKAVLELGTLERFVFVMSVLEGYSYQDCSILLGCSRQAVVNARTRALKHVADVAEMGARHGEGLQSTYSLIA
jgi:DNA-directed RNA polymerase specialized sigma24 family protein